MTSLAPPELRLPAVLAECGRRALRVHVHGDAVAPSTGLPSRQEHTYAGNVVPAMREQFGGRVAQPSLG